MSASHVFERDKDTMRMVRFRSKFEADDKRCNWFVYIPATIVERLGDPERIRLRFEAAE